MLAPQGQYYNYSGCGNTLNCNHPVVRQFIIACLRYWVTEVSFGHIQTNPKAAPGLTLYKQWVSRCSQRGNKQVVIVPSMRQRLSSC